MADGLRIISCTDEQMMIKSARWRVRLFSYGLSTDNRRSEGRAPRQMRCGIVFRAMAGVSFFLFAAGLPAQPVEQEYIMHAESVVAVFDEAMGLMSRALVTLAQRVEMEHEAGGLTGRQYAEFVGFMRWAQGYFHAYKSRLWTSMQALERLKRAMEL